MLYMISLATFLVYGLQVLAVALNLCILYTLYD